MGYTSLNAYQRVTLTACMSSLLLKVLVEFGFELVEVLGLLGLVVVSGEAQGDVDAGVGLRVRFLCGAQQLFIEPEDELVVVRRCGGQCTRRKVIESTQTHKNTTYTPFSYSIIGRQFHCILTLKVYITYITYIYIH